MATSDYAAPIALTGDVATPTVGLGVYTITDAAVCEASVKAAPESGYRLVDTAVVYGSERPVGRGLAASRAWRAMEEAVDAGKIRSIGVSNFEQSDIEQLLAEPVFAELDTGKPNRRMPRWLQRWMFPKFRARQLA